VESILIEPNQIGMPKVCGELFSWEALPHLENWKIPLIYIKKTNFINNLGKYSFEFPKQAGSISRQICETKLFERAQKKGVEFLLNTNVLNIQPINNINKYHKITLSN